MLNSTDALDQFRFAAGAPSVNFDPRMPLEAREIARRLECAVDVVRNDDSLLLFSGA